METVNRSSSLIRDSILDCNNFVFFRSCVHCKQWRFHQHQDKGKNFIVVYFNLVDIMYGVEALCFC